MKLNCEYPDVVDGKRAWARGVLIGFCGYKAVIVDEYGRMRLFDPDWIVIQAAELRDTWVNHKPFDISS